MTSQRCIVLLGVGHTNAEVVHRWADEPLPDCRLVCISKFARSTYSGMLTGTLAGQFDRQEMQIELRPLADRAGAELIVDEVVEHDAEKQSLWFQEREPLHYDVMSVGVGSMPVGWDDIDSSALVPIKPMQTFLERLDRRLHELQNREEATHRCMVAGGGVAGVEVALCLQSRLRTLGLDSPEVAVVTAGSEIGNGLRKGTRRQLRKLLEKRSIQVISKFRVVDMDHQTAYAADGRAEPMQVMIWATGAAPVPVVEKLGLPLCDDGFLATDRTLRSTSRRPVFAVGDCGTMVGDRVPKAGVYAVREAPILWHNLAAMLGNRPLKEYRPQSNFLKILNTGDGKGLLEYGRLHMHATWCRVLKDRIDQRFIRKYQHE